MFGGDDTVDDAVLRQVFALLDAGGDGFAGGEFDDARPEEAEEGAGFGEGDVSGGSPGCHDPAGGGVAQVYDEGQVSVFVSVDGGGDGYHECECGGAFLHAGAAGGWGDEQW